ncbi:MAG: hypothetical protein AB1791_00290 [Chloroflexota bacterium]
MPVFQVGDMWSAYPMADLFLVTTNSTVRQDGALVMGRGIARQARDRFLGLDKALGQQILKTSGRLGEYSLLISPRWPEARLGAFQVKTLCSQPADLEMIQRSVLALQRWCREHPEAHVCLNFPGIGNGRLAREKVLPIVYQLPDKVTIWEYPATAQATPAEQKPGPERPTWLPDARDVETMVRAAEKFFSMPDIPMSVIKRDYHIFAAAFYRGAGSMYERMTTGADPVADRQGVTNG